MKTDHPDLLPNYINKNEFNKVEDSGWVGIFFGVKDFEKRHNNKWYIEYEDLGSIDFDYDFNPSMIES